jgi:hypothetical protein
MKLELKGFRGIIRDAIESHMKKNGLSPTDDIESFAEGLWVIDIARALCGQFRSDIARALCGHISTEALRIRRRAIRRAERAMDEGC